MLVLFAHHVPGRIGHRDDGTVEASLGDGPGGAALTLGGVGIDSGAGEALQRGDQVR